MYFSPLVVVLAALSSVDAFVPHLKPSRVSSGPFSLYSTVDKPTGAAAKKAKKLAKLETLKIESASLLQPLKDVSTTCHGNEEFFHVVVEEHHRPGQTPLFLAP